MARPDKQGRSSYDDTLRGLSALARHGVDFNVLVTVSSANVNHPLEIYRHLKGLGAHFIQFNPVVNGLRHRRRPSSACTSPCRQHSAMPCPPRRPQAPSQAPRQASVNNPDLFNTDCSVMPLIAYLTDHKAATLDRVLETVERFIAAHPTDPAVLQLLPAAGSAGIEAATNIVVRDANRTMLLYVYTAVIALCLVTFRSWRAVLVAVIPLVLTSILCEALMVILGIGVKVATLPVIALGVGIGVNYALYLLSVQLAGQRRGLTLAKAYGDAVMFTGRVVALVGVTLAAGVITWAFSPIKSKPTWASF